MRLPAEAERRERPSAQAYVILGILLAVAALSWVQLARQNSSAAMEMAAAPFLAIWVVMMVAMMFPSAAPMILTFHRIQLRRITRGSFAATWLFVAGYLLLWALSGLAAYALARGADAAAAAFALSPRSAARLGGAVLILAGIYQFTPLKNLCLTQCRTPLTFIMTSWRPGMAGAFRMGWRHGLYCFGCCWLLFVILFPLGMMNVAAMAAITLLIFAEKTVPWGRWIPCGSAAALIVYGLAVLAIPDLLPTFSASAGMTMAMPGMQMQDR